MSDKDRNYWRSLDQYTNSPHFQGMLGKEYPESMKEGEEEKIENAWSRRNFLTLMGASIAMAGLASCRKPVEHIIPYVDRPEELDPGTPLSYATTMTLGHAALGMLVTSHNGRPTKIEGNPAHPASGGAASVLMQASTLNLYDPDRSKQVLNNGKESDWQSFINYWNVNIARNHQNGDGLVILSETFSSPSLWRLRSDFLKAYPKARWIAYDAVSDENIYQGTEIAFGKRLQPIYDLDKADTIISLDSDFLNFETDSVRNAASFAKRRQVLSEKDSMNRLYAIESTFSLTGAAADHRLRIPASQVAGFTLSLANQLTRLGVRIEALGGVKARPGTSYNLQWLALLSEELVTNRGRSLFIAGRRQPAAVHALTHALNKALGNDGVTVNYVDPKDSLGSSKADLASLTSEMKSGKIRSLVMIGGNPAYNAPADLKFDEALAQVPVKVHLGTHNDKTSQLSTWHINRTHFLESWGDARSVDGTISAVQPLIAPLHGGISEIEIASLLAGGQSRSGYEIVRESWKKLISNDFEKGWRKSLHDGVLLGSAGKLTQPGIKAVEVRNALNAHAFPQLQTDKGGLELVFYDSYLHDGRFANNGWLQELPDPISRLAWDNVALVSDKTAKDLGVKSEDMVRLSIDGRDLEMPIWISYGQADNCVAVALGYGHKDAGRSSNGIGGRGTEEAEFGFNTFSLRSSSESDFALGLIVTPTGSKYELANVQDHGHMEERPILREATLAAYQNRQEKDPFKPEQVEHPPLAALWDEHKYDKGYQWGMTIDLNACNGCNACVIACQSENNIQVVGKDEVRRGREMHWIRLDRYYVNNPDNSAGANLDDVDVAIQPVTCQQCENAPCETVCPVGATVHDDEGLNVMVYNRCIGTRYCSNNCPYKVRRFNYYNLTKDLPELIQMAQNPEVTVRSRGVMEKCTYCVQRISTGKIAAKREGREVRDGDIQTACQQTCPANAITFGNIRDEKSQVAKMKKVTRNYNLLEELFTKPRTSYLAKLRNPNPEMKR